MKDLILGDSIEALMDYRGKTPKKLGADFTIDGVPVVSAQLVAHGVLNLEEARYVALETHDAWMSTPTQRGDVLLTSEAPLGRVARVPSNEPLVLGQRLFGLRGRAGELDNGFLYYALQTERVQADLVARSTGSTVFGIRQSALRHVLIPAPTFPEQRAIAQVLCALDDKIAANTGIVTTTDTLAASLTRSALDMTQHLALNEIALITMGSSPPGTSYNEAGEGMVFYQGVRDFGVRYPVNRVWTTEPVRMARAGDCLLSVRAPVGQLNLSGEDTCIGRGLASVCSHTATPMTLFHLLRDAPEAWAPYEAEGTIFGSINKTQLEALSLPIVSEGLADDLERHLGALEASIASCLDENIKLVAMRDALLPMLMSGKIRVTDAEQMAGDVV